MHEPVAPSPAQAAGDDEPKENPDMIPRNLAPVLSTVSAAALVISLGAAAQPALAQNAAATAAPAIPQGTGYFASDSKLPFLAPDFTKISEDDYIPAFEQGMAIARVSAVGAGMPSTPGTAARMFRCLAEAGINIEMIATSEIRTSCVVAEADGIRALQAVHGAFGLGGSTQHEAEGTEAPQTQAASGAPLRPCPPASGAAP